MKDEIKQTMYDHAEEDPFQTVAKNSVKLKKTSRGISWEIKIVTGEENLMVLCKDYHKQIHKKDKYKFQ